LSRQTILGLAALLAAACGTVKTPTEAPQQPQSGPALSFAQIQAQIFTPTCAKSGCHDTAAASGGMVLAAGQSYGQIVGHPSQENPALERVQPGNPEASYLLKKVRGDADISGTRMPQDGPPFLTSDQIAGIAGWIRGGAPR
jgi:hypothetical protein